MGLKDTLLDRGVPLTFFEVVPPATNRAESINATVDELKKIQDRFDALNLPEIRDETRAGERQSRFVPRVDARRLGARILGELDTEVVLNHVVVHQPDPLPWFKETSEGFGIRSVVLVGGESSKVRYPGPGVVEAAETLRAGGPPLALGGITIPSRTHEAERIRRKNAAGLVFFTSQVLFDSNDIVWLIQRLNGLEARVFLSFAPVSQPHDLEFLRWLGADVPRDLDRFLLQGGEGPRASATCLERSLDLAQRILIDVFDNLPPDPPPIGLNIEHINRRNFAPAVQMLERLGNLYAGLMAAHSSSK